MELDVIFNMFKVRYAKLDEIISKNCTVLTPQSKINLFINLEPIMRKLASSDVDLYLKVKKEDKVQEMISSIVNLAAHYRKFFSNNKLYSEVYMYMGYPFNTHYKNRGYDEKYRTTYEHKYTKDPKQMILGHVLDSVIPFTKVILEYIKGVYFIESGDVEPSVIPHLILQENPSNHVNFMLTTERYDYQYTQDDFYIIRPKRDNSYMVTKENVIRMMKLEDKIVNDIDLPANFVPFILSILGDKNRDISKISRVGLSSIIKLIDHGINQNLINRNVDNINLLIDIIKGEAKSQVLTNYYLTDVHSQYNTLNLKHRYSITSQIVDKFDNVSLRKINEEHFGLYPMYIEEITHATSLLTTTRRKHVFEEGAF